MAQHGPEWLNVEFMEKILRNSEHDESIEVKSMTTEPATAKGDNFTSDMFRVGVEYSRKIAGCKVKEDISLIVKISPTADGCQKYIVEEMRQFDTEIKMMGATLIKMNEILSEDNCRLSPRALYTRKGDPSVLVIEDLVPLGFRMCDRTVGLDLHHCRLAMRGIAKFHASSVALVEKEPDLIKTYQRGLYHHDHPEMMKKYCFNALKALAKEVHNWPELGPSYAKKIDKLASVAYAKVVESTRPSFNEFEVINHGDCWLNNMMFRYNDQGKPIGHIFVDFQFCLWTSPAIDILFFLHTSTTFDVITNHRDAILEEYLDTLRETMSRLGCRTQPPSMAALERSIKDREVFGVILACTLLPVMLKDKSDAESMEELLTKQGDFTDPTINKPIYRKRIVSLLPNWNARGLLDA